MGFFTLRWYSIAYIAGILAGWWYLLRLLDQPGAPMARRHADDLVFYATLGIILGGRLGYAIFYAPDMFLHPVRILRLWDGGMSFHGGVIGVSIGLILFARKNGLNWLRVHDYIACCVPLGLGFGRLANFVNRRIMGAADRCSLGRSSSPAAAISRAIPASCTRRGWRASCCSRCCGSRSGARRRRYDPGKLVGLFLLGLRAGALHRRVLPRTRQPVRGDAVRELGLPYGAVPVPADDRGRAVPDRDPQRGGRRRVEPIAGSESVA